MIRSKQAASLALAILAFSAEAAPRVRADVGEIVETERAFARTAQEEGIAPAFRAYVADDALTFAPDPVPARTQIEDRPGSTATLRWWPVYAGIAASGDLGFTTGPFVHADGDRKAHGWFFSIWRKQPDGRWRWVMDQGTPTREAAAEGPDTPVTALPAGMPSPRRARPGAWQEVLAMEARLADGLAADAHGALPAALADDGRVMRMGFQPAIGRAAFTGRVGAGPARIEAAHLGGAVSGAGDLAYTYGRAAWDQDGRSARGHYVRIWQRRSKGWKLMIDEIVALPPSPSPAAQAATR